MGINYGKNNSPDWQGILILVILFSIIISAMLGCKPKTVLSEQSKTVYVEDTAYVKALESKLDSSEKSTYRLITEKERLEITNAALLQEVLAKPDTTMPVQHFSRQSGETKVEFDYQGRILNFRLSVPEQVNLSILKSDSSDIRKSEISKLKEENQELKQTNMELEERKNKIEYVDNTPWIFKLLPSWLIWPLLILPVYLILRLFVKWLP